LHTRITIWRCPVKQQATSKGSRLNYKDLMRDATLSMMGLPEYLLIFRRWPESEKELALVKPVPHDPIHFPLPQWQMWASSVWGWPETGDSMDETDVLRSEKDSRDEKHICPLPLDITRRVVKMWSNPGDVVLSPYAGIGSEGKVALAEGRRFVGMELKAAFFKQGAEWCEGEDRQKSLFDSGAL
jgi:DNA modification methylase